MDPELEAVEWHDAQLQRVVRGADDVRLEFSQLSVYRRLAFELYEEELGAAVLSLRGGRVVFDPPGDERTSRDSRWVMDCTRSEPVACYDIQSLGRGIGPGQIEFGMADGSTLSAAFDSAQLTLVGPLRQVGKYEGPLRPPSSKEPEPD